MERLLSQLDYDHDRFLFLYGNCVNDRFITKDYQEINILECLWLILKEKKFDRILFFSHTKRVIFYDQRSRELCFPKNTEIFQSSHNCQIPENNLFFEGPLGRRQMIRKPPRVHDEDISKKLEPNQTSQISDIDALDLLDYLMKDTEYRTAIVIEQAQTAFRYFGIQGAQAGKFGSWASLPSDNHNLCIFLFAFNDLPSRIDDNQDSVIPIPEIAEYFKVESKLRHSTSILKIPEPQKEESMRLLDYMRIYNEIPLLWKERSRMAEILAADGKTCKKWLELLPQFDELSLKSLSPRLESSRNSAMTWREELDQMIGLSEIKNRIPDLESYIKDNLERIENGQKSVNAQPSSYHMALIGNPGTGKTMVANLMGEMYRDLGILKRGHVNKVEYKDLVDSAVGETPKKTNDQIDKALDGILFIDEAYTLTEEGHGDFGKEVINTLITRMENDRDRLVVIFAGYKKNMPEFFKNANTGLTSRIPEENRITISDYSPSELFSMFKLFLRNEGIDGSPEFFKSIEEIIENMYLERDENTFGNGRSMRELADSVIRMRSRRKDKNKLSSDTPLLQEDISQYYNQFLRPPIPCKDELMNKFNTLVGLDEVKEKVNDLYLSLTTIQDRKKKGQKIERPNLNVSFIGNPGTGKTTVANLMGEIYRATGVLRKGHVHRVIARNLVAGYVGQTAQRSYVEMEKALDGVLFIDEAYALTPPAHGTSYNQEVINTLMEFIDKYKERVVVILAGYPENMDKFLDSNPGLLRRVPNRINFQDYSNDDLIKILELETKKMNISLHPEILPLARAYFDWIRKKSGINFGNASVVEDFIQRMLANQNRRYELSKDANVLDTFLPEDAIFQNELRVPQKCEKLYQHYDLVSQLPVELNELTNETACLANGFLQIQTDNGDASGSGFVVTPKGHLLTAYHVIENANKVKFRFEGSQNELDAEIVGFDKSSDIAILRLPIGQTYPWLSLAEPEYLPSKGQEVIVLGYPLGQKLGEEITLTEGVVSSIRAEGDIIQISAAVTHGSSGGPVLRKKDLHVIGVIHGGAKEIGNFNFAINTRLFYSHFASAPSE